MTDSEISDLYRWHGYAIFRRCLAYLGDEGAAQDALQEVFVRALRAGSGFRGEGSPHTWLSRIADHHCIDLLRRRRLDRRHAQAPVADEGEDDVMITAVSGDEPERVIEARRLVAALDPASRRLAVSYFLDEMTQEEMAAETGLSRKTIGRKLRAIAGRARSMLEGEAA